MPQNSDLPSIQVYFSAPSYKNDSEKTKLLSIRQAILKLGYRFTYDWLEDGEKLSAKKLYEKAISGINRADLVVAEVSEPSTGVGQQIAYAVENKIPVIALKEKGKSDKNSRFTLGSEDDLLKIYSYRLPEISKMLELALSEQSSKRFEKFNFVSTPEINNYLSLKSDMKGISKSQLLRQIIKEKMLQDK